MSWTIAAIITANLLGVGVAGFMQTHCFGRMKNPLIGYIVFCSMLSLTILAFPRLESSPPQIIAVDPVTAADVENLRAVRAEMRQRVDERIRDYHAGM